jgi:hypothetical protein
MSSSCVPIAIYLDKMFNILQTHPYTFSHILKPKFHKCFGFGMCVPKKSKVSACVKTTLLLIGEIG